MLAPSLLLRSFLSPTRKLVHDDDDDDDDDDDNDDDDGTNIRRQGTTLYLQSVSASYLLPRSTTVTGA